VCGAKQTKQPTTTMDQAIIIITKLKLRKAIKKTKSIVYPVQL
jgi:hypothetical protein